MRRWLYERLLLERKDCLKWGLLAEAAVLRDDCFEMGGYLAEVAVLRDDCFDGYCLKKRLPELVTDSRHIRRL